MHAMDGAVIERQLREFFETRAEAEGIAAAWLFGSVARGTARSGSDVDVAVLFSEDPPQTLAGYRFDLESDLQALLRLPVQLVVLNRASIDLIRRIMLEGRLLVNQDPSKRVQFEVRKRNEYWDLEPDLLRYRRQGASRA